MRRSHLTVRIRLARWSARVSGLVALAVLLGEACNHELGPFPGTGSEAGGGRGGNATCMAGVNCVQSCSADPSSGAVPGSCDATGAFICPANRVHLSTCPPDACVQWGPFCCDETTGAFANPPCGSDGLKQACPAGSHVYDPQIGCIPAGLGTTTCRDLDRQPCSLQNQGCTQGAVICSCGHPTASDQLSWSCGLIEPLP